MATIDELRQEVVDYIRFSLGDGMVDVELDPEHYDIAIDHAFRKYRQRSSNSVEESNAILKIEEEQNEFILPDEIIEVRQIFRRGIGSTQGTTQFEPFSAGYLNTYMLVAGRVGGLASYELYSGYQELAMRMFGGHINFHFDTVTKKLTIVRRFPEGSEGEEVLLWIYNLRPDQALLTDPYASKWLMDYALAGAKQMLGQAYEKHATIAGPQGGVTLNGGALKAEAAAELTSLEESLKNYEDGGTPLTWVIG